MFERKRPLEYGLYNCWNCLCEVCTMVYCPYHAVLPRYRHDHCFKMFRCDFCPVKKCDYFDHRQKHLILKVTRKKRRADTIAAKLDRILKLLGEGGKK